jgi:hypothetical protein
MNEQRDAKHALRSLLGPEGPEISCEECFEALDRYVEAELELGEGGADSAVPGMRAHLEGCPACGEDHRSLRALLQSQVAFPKAPPGD